MTYEEALARVRDLNLAEPGINPVCAHQVLDHGERVERAIVLIHGMTACPAMYRELAEQLRGTGANVFVPRLPRHGLADRLTDEQRRMSADELIAAGTLALEIAAGLGERVTVAGLSLGGTLTAWLAQFRTGIDRAVLVSPLIAAPWMPEWLSDVTGTIAQRIPNRYLWWDLRAREAIRGPDYSYPRFSTRAYAEMLRLSDQVRRGARASRPPARDLRLVLNAADPAVNNAATLRLAAAWKRWDAMVSTYQFPRSMGLIHDLISPEQVGARTADVYPVLIEQITRDLPLAT